MTDKQFLPGALTLDVERLAALFERLTGQRPTPAELERARERLQFLRQTGQDHLGDTEGAVDVARQRPETAAPRTVFADAVARYCLDSELILEAARCVALHGDAVTRALLRATDPIAIAATVLACDVALVKDCVDREARRRKVPTQALQMILANYIGPAEVPSSI